MSYTDANGILFLETTDPITPFQALMNTMQAATSDAVAGAGFVNRPKMYAVKGTGTVSLPENTYTWPGTLAGWSLVGNTVPTEFSYDSSDRTGMGVGLKANVDGLFRVSSSVQFPASSVGYRFLRILKNGVIVKKNGGPAATSGRTCLNIEMTCYLSAGDILGVQMIQDAGSTQSIYTGEDSPHIVMTYLGPPA